MKKTLLAPVGGCASLLIIAGIAGLATQFQSDVLGGRVGDEEAQSIWGGELCLNSGKFVTSSVTVCNQNCIPIFPLLLDAQGTNIRYKYSTFAYCWDINGIPGNCGFYQDFVGCNGSQPPPFPIPPDPPG